MDQPVQAEPVSALEAQWLDEVWSALQAVRAAGPVLFCTMVTAHENMRSVVGSDLPRHIYAKCSLPLAHRPAEGEELRCPLCRGLES